MKVIVTRPRDQAGPLVARLEALGHDVIECPLIEIERTSDEPVEPARGEHDRVEPALAALAQACVDVAP